MLETKESKKEQAKREQDEALDFLLDVFAKQERPTAYNLVCG